MQTPVFLTLLSDSIYVDFDSRCNVFP